MMATIRWVGRTWGAAALTFLMLFTGSHAAHRPAHAAGIVVTTLADANPPATDGLCSLREAITNANNNAATYPDCPAGTGADTITFSISGTITLAAALPDIADSAGLIIDGSGQSLTVSGQSSLPILSVGTGARLEVRSLALMDGRGAFLGNAISNDGTLDVTDSTITNLRGFLGGISNTGILTLISSTMKDGNGIRNSDTLLVANSTIRGVDAPGGAGAVFNTGTVMLTRSTISANRAGAGGGVSNTGTLAVTDSTIAGNTASAGGGGIWNAGTLTVTNSTITGNTAPVGGGGVWNAGTLTVTNATITGNHAPGICLGTCDGGEGGGVWNSGALTIVNSVVAGNRGLVFADCSGPLNATGPNLIGDPTGCTVAGTPPITGDPMLGPLADNGGPTPTHALLPGSPAIDAGDDAVCAAAPVSGKDQRGVSRPQGAHCDLGAFELETSPPVVGGKNLRINTGSIDLSWDGETAQTGYTLLQYNANAGTSTLIPLPANATSYSYATAVPGAMYCYALAATGPGDVVLALSDLLCGMTGLEQGTAIPQDFALSLNQSTTASLTWAAPVGGADSYLLARLPLDATPPVPAVFPGSTTATTQVTVPAGMCFELIAYRGGGLGTSNVLCGVPGFSALGKPAGGRMQTVGEAMGALEAQMSTASKPR